jgi:hypothetical protein
MPIKFFITQEIGSNDWYRECANCGCVTVWSNENMIPNDDCTQCLIPFNGEVNSEDILETVPGCYGL